jgi:uncharacterized repeat protein (TIGR02543 family)
MKKKMTRVSAVCFAVSLASLFIACELLETESKSSPRNDGKAVVRIQIGDSIQGRTVKPDAMAAVTEWKLSGTRDSNSELSNVTVTEGMEILLNPGSWNFTLEGLNSSGIPVLTQTKSQTISTTEDSILMFEVEPVADGNNGNVIFNIKLPPGHGITSAQVFKETETSPYKEIDVAINDEKIAFSSDSFERGEYYLSIRLLKNNELYGVISEIVYVWPHLDSVWDHEVKLDDLKRTYLVEYWSNDEQIWVGNLESGIVHDYRRTDIARELKAADTEDDYHFRGWYKQSDFSGEKVTHIGGGDTEDRKFYARWVPANFSIPNNFSIPLVSLSDGSNFGSLESALNFIKTNAEVNEAYTITLINDETLLDSKTLGYDGKAVTITLKGNTSQKVSLYTTKTGSLFNLETGATLILDDKITLQGQNDNTAPLVQVNTNAMLKMNFGSKISGNITTSGNGGGVYVAGGSFTMEDGEISGNSGRLAGGVYINGGSFTMEDGEISGNSSSTSGGGGVQVADGSFTMEGGEISGNTAATYGGGVYVNGGTFEKKSSGGKIYGSNNTLQNEAQDDGSGHAVYVSGGIMKRDSTVNENEALNSNSSGDWVDTWTVTFNAGNGTATSDTEQVSSRSDGSSGSLSSMNKSLPSASYTYEFGGWYTEPNSVGAETTSGTEFTVDTPVKRDTTVWAKWNKLLYTIENPIKLRPMPGVPNIQEEKILSKFNNESFKFDASSVSGDYQWYLDHKAITGATNSEYTLSANAVLFDEQQLSGGVYELSVVVTTSMSSPATKSSARCRVIITEY